MLANDLVMQVLGYPVVSISCVGNQRAFTEGWHRALNVGKELPEGVAEWTFDRPDVNNRVKTLKFTDPTQNSCHNIKVCLAGVIQAWGINEREQGLSTICRCFRFRSCVLGGQPAKILKFSVHDRLPSRVQELIFSQGNGQGVVTYGPGARFAAFPNFDVRV